MACEKSCSVALVTVLLVVVALLPPARAWCGVTDKFPGGGKKVDSSHSCRCVVENTASDEGREQCCLSHGRDCLDTCDAMSGYTDDKCRQHCIVWAKTCISGVDIDGCFCDGANGTDWGADWDEYRYQL